MSEARTREHFGATEEVIAYSNTALKILDGQECGFDSNYDQDIKIKYHHVYFLTFKYQLQY